MAIWRSVEVPAGIGLNAEAGARRRESRM